MVADDCACITALAAPDFLVPSEAWKVSCRSSYNFLYNSLHSGQVLLSLALRSHWLLLLGYSCEAKTDLVEVARRVASDRGRSMLFHLFWVYSSRFM